MLFCDFPDEMNLPDHSTLNRFRNWLIQDHLLDELLEQINQQLAQKQLKVQQAQTAIVDASIIQTAGGKQKKAIEVYWWRRPCGANSCNPCQWANTIVRF